MSLQRQVFKYISFAAKAHDAQLIVCTPSDDVITLCPEWERVYLPVGSEPYRDCYTRLLCMLRHCKNDLVFVVEHDVLYPPNYFDMSIDDIAKACRSFMYQVNLLTLTDSGFNQHNQAFIDRVVTSQLVSQKSLLQEHYRRSIDWLDSGCQILWDEPGLDWADDGIAFPKVAGISHRRTTIPSVDVRWGGNLTGDRKYLARTGKKIDGYYGEYQQLRKELGI